MLELFQTVHIFPHLSRKLKSVKTVISLQPYEGIVKNKIFVATTKGHFHSNMNWIFVCHGKWLIALGQCEATNPWLSNCREIVLAATPTFSKALKTLETVSDPWEGSNGTSVNFIYSKFNQQCINWWILNIWAMAPKLEDAHNSVPPKTRCVWITWRVIVCSLFLNVYFILIYVLVYG